MDMQIVAEGLRFPEGPVWLTDGSIVLVEIEAGRITRVYPDGRKETVATPGGGPNGAALGPNGKLYVCNNGGFAWSDMDGLLIPGTLADDYSGGRIEVVDLESGAVEVLIREIDGRPLSGPNDLVFDAHGGFYFTDLGKIRAHSTDHGGVFYAKADGSGAVTVAYPVDHPNGCGLSPDGKTLYVAQTSQRNLLAFDIEAPGKVTPTPFFPGRVVSSWPGRALLDSMAVTADGQVVVATLLDGAGLTSVDPLTGAHTHYPCPDLLTTNICFGGPDMRDAWVCLSTTGKLARMRWDRPGLQLAYHF
jgi:gluconolactonase